MSIIRSFTIHVQNLEFILESDADAVYIILFPNCHAAGSTLP